MTGMNDWEADLGWHKRNLLFLLVCFWHNDLEINYCSIGNSAIYFSLKFRTKSSV